jgi:multiple sugar transport system ATP-binding protein
MNIQVNNLVKRFDRKVAVADNTFTVGDEEFLVLVGPSGCGKTTTLRLIVGLEAATSGSIFFGIRDVTRIRPRDRNVAMVFQDYAVFPHMTVFDNIAYGLRSRGNLPRYVVKEKVEEAAKMFRIDHLLGRKPRQISGGERQRVALSRAMVRDADVYLFDEPLSNLDAQLRHQAREDILSLHKTKQRPTVYVTHDQSEAMALGDRIAVMCDGRIEQIGTGTDLYERPANQFVAFFIGAPSINLFDVTLETDQGGLFARCEAFRVRLPGNYLPLVERYIGRPVRLGLRPEDFASPKNAKFEVTEENTLAGLLNVIEPTATGCAAYLNTLDRSARDFVVTFKMRLPASYLGREIPLAMNTARVHLFDSETEASLLVQR